MNWHDLEKTTLIKLRDMAHDQGMKGVTGWNKEKLVEELAGQLSIEKPHEDMTAIKFHSKTDLKLKIRELKLERNSLIEAHDHKGLKTVRRQIHGLKRQIRKIHLDKEKLASS